MAAFESLVGTRLVRKSSNGHELIATSEALEGKAVLMYFSAHWCPPCRRFTPMLIQSYNQMKAAGKNVEVVFVSSDKDANQFNQYYGEMPWLALPFEERALKESLSGNFSIQGIPTLLVFGENGELISKNGRNNIMADPTGSNFPWIPRPVQNVLADSPLLSSNGAVDGSALSGKYLGLYFSAHWCPPCRAFTPKLASMYNDRKAAGLNDFEVVFVSADNSQEEFDEYFSEMPWLALPYGDGRADVISAQYSIQGYPTLIIISPEGEVINADGTSAVRGDPTGAKFPFFPQPVEELDQSTSSYGFSLEQKPTFVLFMENQSEEEQQHLKTMYTEFANTYSRDRAKSAQGPMFLFFTVPRRCNIGTRLRTMLSLGDVSSATAPALVLLNLPAGGYFLPEGEVNATTIETVIEGFRAGSLSWRHL